MRFIVFTLFIVNIIYSQIIFTEIMFDVEGSDAHNEFVEIYNLSQTESVNLSGWQFSDSLSRDNLTDAGWGITILPRQYAVILDGSYWGNSTTYDDIIPDTALIITIDNNAFGNGGLTNSKSRRLSLIDASGKEVQVYRYSIGNESGYSDEKIRLNSDNSIENWADSKIKGGTPGRRNSHTPFQFDLGFTQTAIDYHPAMLVRTKQTVHFECAVSNLGLDSFSGVLNLLLFTDENKDSIFSAGEKAIIDIETDISLDSAQIQIFTGLWTPETTGIYRVSALLSSTEDQNEINNYMCIDIPVFESRETVSINEIKFLNFEGEPEWIELVNKGSEPLSLKDWAIADLKDTCRIDTVMKLYPGQYKVLASGYGLQNFYQIKDSLICVLPKIPTLNNSEEVVYLLNPAGGWVEQVPYKESWLEGEEWRKPSLERINHNLDSRQARNWGPSTTGEGATAGKENSIYSKIVPEELEISVQPNPFSPDGDGYEDHTLISVNIPASASRARIEIFDISGRRIRTITDNSFTGSTMAAVWNGRSEKGEIVNMGIYIIFVQILDDRNGLLAEQKETVVVARRL